jgi:hypothetical protein
VVTQPSDVSGTGRKEYPELQCAHNASQRSSIPWSSRHHC